MNEKRESIPIRPPMPTRTEFELLVMQANAGDAKAIQELGHILDDWPKIWRSLGNLSAVAGNSFLRLASNGNRLVSKSIGRYVSGLRKELTGPAPSRLERMAIERLLLTWAMAHYTDCVLASLANVSRGTVSMWLRRQAQAGRQLDQAIKSLATLRKLLPTAAERAAGRSRRA